MRTPRTLLFSALIQGVGATGGQEFHRAKPYIDRFEENIQAGVA